ncbi:MAG: UDP-N-acetylmuramoyl-L-alanine--D-glutamate ligase [bacterium]
MSEDDIIENISSKTVGVYGFGRTGRAVAEVLTEWGVEIVVLDDLPPGEVEREDYLEIDSISWQFQPEKLPENIELLVISPGLPREHKILKQARGRGIPVLGELELAYRLCEGKIWAITGTNGKSTCTKLSGEFLSEMFAKNFEVCGNLGRPLIKAVFEGDNNSEDNYVVEVSSFQVEGMRDFAPDNSLLLNLGDDHQDRHSSLKEYHSLKIELMSRTASGGRVTVPYSLRGDRRLEHLGARCELNYFGKDFAGTVKKIKWTGEGLNIEGKIIPREEFPLILRLYPENLLAVLTFINFSGDGDLIREVLGKFQPLPHRVEEIDTAAPVTVINDSKGTNPAAVEALIEKIDSSFSLVLGGGSKDSDFGRLFELLQDSKLRRLNICADSRLEARLQTLARENNLQFEIYQEWETAVKDLVKRAEPGEMVLLSPGATSFDEFDNYRRRGEKFRLWTKEALASENI